MKQIIEAVLQVEEQANTVIREAQAEAAKIKQATEKEISDKSQGAQAQAQEIIQTTVAKARAEAAQLKKTRLAQANQEKDALRQANAELTGALVDRICQTILSTEQLEDIA